MILNLIGAGRVGQTLAHLWVKQGRVRVAGVVNQHRETTLAALEFIGDGQCVASVMALPAVALTLITTPDDAIASVASSLALNPWLLPGSVVAHCSGALSSDSLDALRARGCALASVHPLRSFAHPSDSINQFSSTHCVIEGDDAALSLLTPLFESIGAVLSRIDKARKAFYHAGAVFASNYMLTLVEQARYCLAAAGIEDARATAMIVQLMQNTLSNVSASASISEALTGPLQRGDIQTIEAHLDALSGHQPHTLYAQLARSLLPLTELDALKKHDLETLLSDFIG